MNVSAESVRQQIVSVLIAWGMDADMVRTTADAMLYSDLAGIDSHGVSMLMAYEDYRAEGKLNLRAWVRRAPAIPDRWRHPLPAGCRERLVD